MNKFKIKTILYLLISIVTLLSLAYMYISFYQIKKSTLKALNTESINRAYEVTKQMSALNDKMAWEYNKYDNSMYKILKYAQDYFQKNGQNASIEKLKKELDDNKDGVFYHIYLINSEYVINKTTFTPDMNLDFHLIPEALKIMIKAFNNPDYINLSSVINDAVTNTYKKYIVQKARNQDYIIQISISKKNEQNINKLMDKTSKNIPNLLSTDIYMLYLNNVRKMNIDTFYTNSYKKGTKNHSLVELGLYDKFNIALDEDEKLNENNFRQYISKFVSKTQYKDIYFHKDGKYIHRVIMPFYSYLNTHENTIYIISIELDESEAEQTIQNINNIAYLIFFLGLVLISFSIFVVNTRIIKPIENLQLKMKLKENIDIKSLVNHNDEINSMSLIYNQLLQDLKREINSNEELLEEFKTFTGNTIHQIRTPISVIKIALEMMDTTNQEAKLQIQASLISVEHMYDSLSYILHHDSVIFSKEKLNLSKILEERITLFTTIANAHDREIKYEIKTNMSINMNKTELEYLIDNNLSNAIKYGEVEKEILVRLNENSSEISLSFDSYGKEIKDTKIIFQRFYRNDKSRKGNGIGLHMVDTICSKNNILIKVTSHNNKNKFIYFFEDIS